MRLMIIFSNLNSLDSLYSMMILSGLGMARLVVHIGSCWWLAFCYYIYGSLHKLKSKKKHKILICTFLFLLVFLPFRFGLGLLLHCHVFFSLISLLCNEILWKSSMEWIKWLKIVVAVKKNFRCCCSGLNKWEREREREFVSTRCRIWKNNIKNPIQMIFLYLCLFCSSLTLKKKL